MATASFWARVTSSNANATTLVVGNVSQNPATQLTFSSDNPDTPADENGDLILESTAGAVDPDTWVIINGVAYQFTYDVVGTFPVDNKVPLELQGKLVAVVTVIINGSPVNYFFVLDGTGTQVLMNDVGNGNIRLDNPNTDPPPTPVCFCGGTDILTPSGNRKVETLRAGDHVLNDRGEAKQIMWVGCSRLTAAALRAHPNLRPIRIPEDAISPGRPKTDLCVSPQHRVVLEGPEAELLFGEERVLVPAKHLADSLAEVVPPEAEVAYYHLLLKDHEILVSNGLPSESFQPARRTIDAMSEPNRALLEDVLRTLGLEAMLTRKDRLPSLKRHEALVLADAVAHGMPDTPAAPAADRRSAAS